MKKILHLIFAAGLLLQVAGRVRAQAEQLKERFTFAVHALSAQP